MKTIKKHSPAYWGPNFFDDFFVKDLLGNHEPFTSNLNIPVNVLEDEQSFKIELAVPGFSKEDFVINVEDEVLIISANIESKETTTEGNWTRKEFSKKSFEKRFQMPEMIKMDQINAAYDSGVLMLDLPKDLDEKSSLRRKIEIK